VRELNAGKEFDDYPMGVPCAEHPSGGGANWKPTQVLHFMRPHQKVSPEPGQHPEPFPVQALPEFLRDYVAAVAESIQVPEDLPGLLALAVLSMACSRKFLVDVGGHFTEPLELYVACGLGSGGGKGPTFREVMEPVHSLQRSLPFLKEVVARTWEDLEARLASATMDDEVFTIGEERRLFEPLRDAFRRLPDHLFTADVTSEALVQALSENGERIAVISPEGGGVAEVLLGDRYGRAGRGNLEIWLQSHDEEALHGQRVSRKFPPVDRPALTVAITVQPEVLRELAQNRNLKSRGLAARFMWSLPEDNSGARLFSDETIPSEVRARWRAVALAALLLPDTGRPSYLKLEGAAFEVWRAFYDRTESRLGPGGDFSSCREAANKARGRALRLAGLLHVAKALDRHVAQLEEEGLAAFAGTSSDRLKIIAGLSAVDPCLEPIALDTVRDAISLAEYSLAHAQLAQEMPATSARDALAERVKGWIQRGNRRTFSERECCRDTHLPIKDVKSAMEDLSFYGVIAPRETARPNPTGRYPSREWEVV
jgi:hypothetical protein